MENTKRMNDKTFYENIINLMTSGEIMVDPQEMIDKAQQKIASIERKAERAKERAAEKKAAGDELLEMVKKYLSNEYTTTADIVAAMNVESTEEYSKQKIGYRLRTLVEMGEAEATDLVTTKPDGKKSTVKGYKRA